MPGTWTATRARLARASRSGDPDAHRIAELRALLKAQLLEQRLLEAISSQPTLTTGQLEYLASVLLAARGGDDAA